MTKMSLNEATVSQIGQMFVKQYYLQLNSDPSLVHRFYQDDSSFAHGGHELGSTEIIHGQKVCVCVCVVLCVCMCIGFGITCIFLGAATGSPYIVFISTSGM